MLLLGVCCRNTFSSYKEARYSKGKRAATVSTGSVRSSRARLLHVNGGGGSCTATAPARRGSNRRRRWGAACCSACVGSIERSKGRRMERGIEPLLCPACVSSKGMKGVRLCCESKRIEPGAKGVRSPLIAELSLSSLLRVRRRRLGNGVRSLRLEQAWEIGRSATGGCGRGSGHPKRHLFTTGWSIFLNAKRLSTGDAFIFIRGEDGKLVVGVRRARKMPTVAATSVITTESMQIGILASALHALNTGSMFSVYYRPRASSSEFLVPYNRYMDSAKHNYSIGMRFRMTFEGDDGDEQRHTGTIIGIEDAEPKEWPDSKWKCFKVRWDQPSGIQRPERVCPWDITPFDAAVEPSELSGTKRHRPCRTSRPPKSHAPLRNGSLKICNEPSPKFLGFCHGQDRNAGSLSFSDVPGNAHKPLASHQQKHLPSTFAEIRKVILADQIQNCLSNSAHEKSNMEKYLANASLTTGNGTSRNQYMDNAPKLFGVPLIQNSSHAVLPHAATLNELLKQSMASLHAPHSPSYFHDCDRVSELSNSSKPSEFSSYGILNDQSYVAHPIPFRSCTKVLKHGSVLGRSVDLSRFSGYGELINELDQMFDFKGRLVDCRSSWQVIYTDDEGDTMLIGDYPWQEFCSMVRKIFIYPHEEIDKLKFGC